MSILASISSMLSPWWEVPGLGWLVLVLGVVTLAGFFHGLTGFGYALIVMSALVGLIGFGPVRDSVALMNPFVCLGAFLPHWRKWNPRLGRVMILGAALGAPLGYFLLSAVEEGLARRVFGGFLVSIAVAEWWLSRGNRGGLPAWSGGLCGLLGGSFGGAFNIGGPPLVAYCYSQPWKKGETIATIQVAFLISATIRVSLMGARGEITPDLCRATLVLGIPVLLGIWLGSCFVGRVDREKLRVIAFTAVFVLGIRYLVWA